MPGKISWLDNCPPYVCRKDVSASWSKYNIQKKNTHTKRPLEGWEPEFKGTRGEAYTTSSPPPYLSLGPTHICRNKITITLPEQTGRQNRSAYFTVRAAPSEKYISSLISSQWDFTLLVCLLNFCFTFHNIRNCLPLPLLTLPALPPLPELRVLPYERGGDARRKFWFKPLRETSLGVAQPFFDP